MSQTVVGNLAVELGISDAQLKAGLAQAMAQAQQAGQKMAQAVNNGAKQAWGGNAMGFLNLSRAIDDAQYGLRGVINNIEGVVTGFGFGAGVAGAATVAAVAIGMLAPTIETATTEAKKFFGLWTSEADKARLSVTAMMTAGGTQSALAAVLTEEIKLLKQRNGLATSSAMSPSRIGDTFQVLKMQLNGTAGMKSLDEINLMLQQRRGLEASAKTQEATRLFLAGQKEMAAAQRGAGAGSDMTSGQISETEINKLLFQAAVDKFGGGDNLRTKITQAGKRGGMARSESEELYGLFAGGDIGGTRKIESMLNLGAEKTKIMADDFERITGSAVELARIESDAKQRTVRIEARQFGEYEQAVKQQDNLFARRSAIELQRGRSEILGGMSDVFSRNLNAGQEDPQLKELQEINEGIKTLATLTGLG